MVPLFVLSVLTAITVASTWPTAPSLKRGEHITYFYNVLVQETTGNFALYTGTFKLCNYLIPPSIGKVNFANHFCFEGSFALGC